MPEYNTTLKALFESDAAKLIGDIRQIISAFSDFEKKIESVNAAARTFGTAISDMDFKRPQGIQEAVRGLSEYEQALSRVEKLGKNAVSTFNDITNSIARNSTENQKAAQAVSDTYNNISKLRNLYSDYLTQTQGLTKGTAEYNAEMKKLSETTMVKGGGHLGFKATFAQLRGEIDGSIKGLGEWITANTKATDNFKGLVEQLQKVSDATKSASEETKAVTRELAAQDTTLAKLISRFKEYASVVVMQTAFKSLVDAFRMGKDEMIKFDQEMKNLQAVAGASAYEAKAVSEVLKDIARTPEATKSIAQLADGITAFAQAGLSASESMNAIRATAELAGGTLEKMKGSVDLMTTSLITFDKKAIESQGVADIWANAINISKLDLPMIQTALNYIGEASAQAGMKLEEVAASMMVMSDRGIRASTIGTGLRQVISKILDPTDELAVAFRMAGVELDQLNPNIVGYEGVLKNLSGLLWDVEKQQVDMAKAFEIFQLRGSSAAATLVETFMTGDYNEAIEELGKVGAVTEMVGTQAEGLAAKIDHLISRVKLVGVSFGGTGISEEMSKWVDIATVAVSWIEKIADTAFGKLVTTIGLVVAEKMVLIKVATQLFTVMKASTIYNIAEALLVAAKNGRFLAVALDMLGTINPFMAFITAAGVAIAVTKKFAGNLKETSEQAAVSAINFKELADTISAYHEKLASSIEEGGSDYENVLKRMIKEQPKVAEQLREILDVADLSTVSFEDLSAAMNKAAQSDLSQSVSKNAEALSSLEQLKKSNEESVAQWQREQEGYYDDVVSMIMKSVGAVEYFAEKADKELGETTRNYNSLMKESVSQLTELGTKFGWTREQLEEYVKSMNLSPEVAQEMTDATMKALDKIAAAVPKQVTVFRSVMEQLPESYQEAYQAMSETDKVGFVEFEKKTTQKVLAYEKAAKQMNLSEEERVKGAAAIREAEHNEYAQEMNLFPELAGSAHQKSLAITQDFIANTIEEYSKGFKTREKMELEIAGIVSGIQKTASEGLAQAYQQATSALENSLKGLESKYEQIKSKMSGVDSSIESANKAYYSDIRELQKQTMSDEQKWNDDRAEANRLLAEGTKAQNADMIKEAQAMFKSLSREVKDANGNTVKDVAEAQKVAVEGIEASHKATVDALEAQKKKLADDMEAAREEIDSIRDKIDDYQKKIVELSQTPLKINAQSALADIDGIMAQMSELEKIAGEGKKMTVEFTGKASAEEGLQAKIEKLEGMLKEFGEAAERMTPHVKIKFETDEGKTVYAAIEEIREQVDSVKDLKINGEVGGMKMPDNYSAKLDENISAASAAADALSQKLEVVANKGTLLKDVAIDAGLGAIAGTLTAIPHPAAKAAGALLSFFDAYKTAKDVKDLVVNFKGRGSSETSLSEKIDEMSGKIQDFSASVGQTEMSPVVNFEQLSESVDKLKGSIRELTLPEKTIVDQLYAIEGAIFTVNNDLVSGLDISKSTDALSRDIDEIKKNLGDLDNGEIKSSWTELTGEYEKAIENLKNNIANESLPLPPFVLESEDGKSVKVMTQETIAEIRKIEENFKTAIPVTVDFMGRGSSEKALSEKIAEMSAKMQDFSGYVQQTDLTPTVDFEQLSNSVEKMKGSLKELSLPEKTILDQIYAIEGAIFNLNTDLTSGLDVSKEAQKLSDDIGKIKEDIGKLDGGEIKQSWSELTGEYENAIENLKKNVATESLPLPPMVIESEDGKSVKMMVQETVDEIRKIEENFKSAIPVTVEFTGRASEEEGLQAKIKKVQWLLYDLETVAESLDPKVLVQFKAESGKSIHSEIEDIKKEAETLSAVQTGEDVLNKSNIADKLKGQLEKIKSQFSSDGVFGFKDVEIKTNIADVEKGFESARKTLGKVKEEVPKKIDVKTNIEDVSDDLKSLAEQAKVAAKENQYLKKILSTTRDEERQDELAEKIRANNEIILQSEEAKNAQILQDDERVQEIRLNAEEAFSNDIIKARQAAFKQNSQQIQADMIAELKAIREAEEKQLKSDLFGGTLKVISATDSAVKDVTDTAWSATKGVFGLIDGVKRFFATNFSWYRTTASEVTASWIQNNEIIEQNDQQHLENLEQRSRLHQETMLLEENKFQLDRIDAAKDTYAKIYKMTGDEELLKKIQEDNTRLLLAEEVKDAELLKDAELAHRKYLAQQKIFHEERVDSQIKFIKKQIEQTKKLYETAGQSSGGMNVSALREQYKKLAELDIESKRSLFKSDQDFAKYKAEALVFAYADANRQVEAEVKKTTEFWKNIIGTATDDVKGLSADAQKFLEGMEDKTASAFKKFAKDIKGLTDEVKVIEVLEKYEIDTDTTDEDTKAMIKEFVGVKDEKKIKEILIKYGLEVEESSKDILEELHKLDNNKQAREVKVRLLTEGDDKKKLSVGLTEAEEAALKLQKSQEKLNKAWQTGILDGFAEKLNQMTHKTEEASKGFEDLSKNVQAAALAVETKGLGLVALTEAGFSGYKAFSAGLQESVTRLIDTTIKAPTYIGGALDIINTQFQKATKYVATFFENPGIIAAFATSLSILAQNTNDFVQNGLSKSSPILEKISESVKDIGLHWSWWLRAMSATGSTMSSQLASASIIKTLKNEITALPRLWSEASGGVKLFFHGLAEGTKSIPVVGTMFKTVVNWLQVAGGWLGKIWKWTNDIMGAVVNLRTLLNPKNANTFSSAQLEAMTFTNKIKDMFKGLANWVVDIFKGIATGIINQFSKLGVFIANWFKGLAPVRFLAPYVDMLVGFFGIIKGKIVQVIKVIAPFISKFASAAISTLAPVFSFIITWAARIFSVWGVIDSFIQGWKIGRWLGELQVGVTTVDRSVQALMGSVEILSVKMKILWEGAKIKVQEFSNSITGVTEHIPLIGKWISEKLKFDVKDNKDQVEAYRGQIELIKNLQKELLTSTGKEKVGRGEIAVYNEEIMKIKERFNVATQLAMTEIDNSNQAMKNKHLELKTTEYVESKKSEIEKRVAEEIALVAAISANKKTDIDKKALLKQVEETARKNDEVLTDETEKNKRVEDLYRKHLERMTGADLFKKVEQEARIKGETLTEEEKNKRVEALYKQHLASKEANHQSEVEKRVKAEYEAAYKNSDAYALEANKAESASKKITADSIAQELERLAKKREIEQKKKDDAAKTASEQIAQQQALYDATGDERYLEKKKELNEKIIDAEAYKLETTLQLNMKSAKEVAERVGVFLMQKRKEYAAKELADAANLASQKNEVLKQAYAESGDADFLPEIQENNKKILDAEEAKAKAILAANAKTQEDVEKITEKAAAFRKGKEKKLNEDMVEIVRAGMAEYIKAVQEKTGMLWDNVGKGSDITELEKQMQDLGVAYQDQIALMDKYWVDAEQGRTDKTREIEAQISKIKIEQTKSALTETLRLIDEQAEKERNSLEDNEDAIRKINLETLAKKKEYYKKGKEALEAELNASLSREKSYIDEVRGLHRLLAEETKKDQEFERDLRRVNMTEQEKAADKVREAQEKMQKARELEKTDAQAAIKLYQEAKDAFRSIASENIGGTQVFTQQKELAEAALAGTKDAQAALESAAKSREAVLTAEIEKTKQGAEETRNAIQTLADELKKIQEMEEVSLKLKLNKDEMESEIESLTSDVSKWEKAGETIGKSISDGIAKTMKVADMTSGKTSSENWEKRLDSEGPKDNIEALKKQKEELDKQIADTKAKLEKFQNAKQYGFVVESKIEFTGDSGSGEESAEDAAEGAEDAVEAVQEAAQKPVTATVSFKTDDGKSVPEVSKEITEDIKDFADLFKEMNPEITVGFSVEGFGSGTVTFDEAQKRVDAAIAGLDKSVEGLKTTAKIAFSADTGGGEEPLDDAAKSVFDDIKDFSDLFKGKKPEMTVQFSAEGSDKKPFSNKIKELLKEFFGFKIVTASNTETVVKFYGDDGSKAPLSDTVGKLKGNISDLRLTAGASPESSGWSAWINTIGNISQTVPFAETAMNKMSAAITGMPLLQWIGHLQASSTAIGITSVATSSLASALTVAAGAVGAFFVGWKLGEWLNTFPKVQEVAQTLFAALDAGFTEAKISWLEFKKFFTFDEDSIKSIDEQIAKEKEHIESIKETMKTIGAAKAEEPEINVAFTGTGSDKTPLGDKAEEMAEAVSDFTEGVEEEDDPEVNVEFKADDKSLSDGVKEAEKKVGDFKEGVKKDQPELNVAIKADGKPVAEGVKEAAKKFADIFKKQDFGNKNLQVSDNLFKQYEDMYGKLDVQQKISFKKFYEDTEKQVQEAEKAAREMMATEEEKIAYITRIRDNAFARFKEQTREEGSLKYKDGIEAVAKQIERETKLIQEGSQKKIDAYEKDIKQLEMAQIESDTKFFEAQAEAIQTAQNKAKVYSALGLDKSLGDMSKKSAEEVAALKAAFAEKQQMFDNAYSTQKSALKDYQSSELDSYKTTADKIREIQMQASMERVEAIKQSLGLAATHLDQYAEKEKSSLAESLGIKKQAASEETEVVKQKLTEQERLEAEYAILQQQTWSNPKNLALAKERGINLVEIEKNAAEARKKLAEDTAKTQVNAEKKATSQIKQEVEKKSAADLEYALEREKFWNMNADLAKSKGIDMVQIEKDAADARAEIQRMANTREAEERKNSLSAMTGVEKQFADETSAIDKATLEKKLEYFKQAKEGLQKELDTQVEMQKQAMQKVSQLQKSIADQKKSYASDMREIDRQGMTDAQANADKWAEAQEKIAQANAMGNDRIEEKNALLKEAYDQANSLSSVEIKDGERVIVSKQESAARAKKIMQETHEQMLANMEAQKKIAEEDAKRAAENVKTVTDAMEAANKQIDSMGKLLNADVKQGLDANAEAAKKYMDELSKQITLDIDTRAANSKLDALIAKYQELGELKSSASSSSDSSDTSSSGGDSDLGLAAGGSVPGTGIGDTVPAMLTPGEHVQPVSSVQKYGVRFMEMLRHKIIPREAIDFVMNTGVQRIRDFGSRMSNIRISVPEMRLPVYQPRVVQTFASGGPVMAAHPFAAAPNMGSLNLTIGGASGTVYGDPDFIKTFMTQVKREQSMGYGRRKG